MKLSIGVLQVLLSTEPLPAAFLPRLATKKYALCLIEVMKSHNVNSSKIKN